MQQNTQNTALLVMDMQAAFARSFPNSLELIASTAKAIAHARNNKIPVIYVAVGFRNGFPEVSPNNKGFMAAKERFAGVDMNEFVKIDPELAPKEGEVTMIKRRVSAFTGSDLEVVLRAKGIQHMVLTGVATSGVVLSTVREASDKDYALTVLSDCCADQDAEVHQVLMTKIFPRQAEVLTSAEWCK